MKTALKISVLLNLGLLACLAFAWSVREKPETRGVRPVSAQSIPTISTAPSTVSQPIKPFRWSQLAAADYHDYVKNLRAIGCPEAALRAIVTADVDVVYEERTTQLEKELTDLQNGSLSGRLASASTEQNLRDEMQKLPDEELAQINDYLGLKTAATTAGVASTGPEDDPQDAPPVNVPLVLQDNVDLTKLGLSAEQLQAIDNLRQDFVNKVGGTNQDPNDPAYLARWQQNLAAADSMFVATMGSDVYAQYLVLQNQAVNAGQGR